MGSHTGIAIGFAITTADRIILLGTHVRTWPTTSLCIRHTAFAHLKITELPGRTPPACYTATNSRRRLRRRAWWLGTTAGIITATQEQYNSTHHNPRKRLHKNLPAIRFSKSLKAGSQMHQCTSRNTALLITGKLAGLGYLFNKKKHSSANPLSLSSTHPSCFSSSRISPVSYSSTIGERKIPPFPCTFALMYHVSPCFTAPCRLWIWPKI